MTHLSTTMLIQWRSAIALLGMANIVTQTHASVLTPQLLVEAPRPNPNIVVNEARSTAVIGVGTPSTSTGQVSNTLYEVPLDSPKAWDEDDSKVKVLMHGVDEAHFLDDQTLVFIDGKNVQYRTMHDSQNTTLLHLPTSVENVQSVRTANDTVTLVFSAVVYDDGDLYAVPEHDKNESAHWKRARGT